MNVLTRLVRRMCGRANDRTAGEVSHSRPPRLTISMTNAQIDARVDLLRREIDYPNAQLLASMIATAEAVVAARDGWRAEYYADVAPQVQYAWGAAITIADRVRGNRKAITNEQMPDLFEAAYAHCAARLELTSPVEITL